MPYEGLALATVGDRLAGVVHDRLTMFSPTDLSPGETRPLRVCQSPER